MERWWGFRIFDSIADLKFANLLWMVSGMSQSFGFQSDGICVFGSYSSSDIFGFPAKNTLVRKSLWKRAKDSDGLRLGLRGVGQNLRPRPIIVLSDLGTVVSALVRSCIARFAGREK